MFQKECFVNLSPLNTACGIEKRDLVDSLIFLP